MQRGKRQSEKGQASIMIGMIVLTFILFFAFVVNTGMLVNAKINLQNAADLAAYSGAAVQARQLTDAAYLNYEMRRQYKKFLFRYYVVGSFMYTTFPDQVGKAVKAPRVWATNPTSPVNFNVPVVCLNLYAGTGPAAEGNYCQTTTLPKIIVPPPNALDSINSALREQLQRLEEIRVNSCQTIADTNIQVLTLWLFNTDPNGLDPNSLDFTGANAAYVARMKTAYLRMKGVTYGLGLVPKELFLRQRIATMQAYLNSQPRQGLSIQQVEAMRNSGDPSSVERSINAFQSAYETLGEHIFPDSSITMDELLPTGTDGALVANFKDILQDFDTYALTYEHVAGTGTTEAAVNTDCKPRAYPITLRRVPLGVFKDPTVLTYYAIRLKAKARILFSPFGDIELKAYSAAMPFGSRIGPTDEKLTDLFARTNIAPPANLLHKGTVAEGDLFDTIVQKVPNLPILADETAQAGNGWDSTFAQYHFYSTLLPTNGANQLSMEELSRGMQAAMVPNPWEAGRYNIINDLGPDPFIRNFDKYKTAMLWSPIVPVDKNSQLNDIMRDAVDKMFAAPGGTGIDPNKVGQFNLGEYKTALLDTLSQYINKVRAGQGEGDPYTSNNPPPPDAPHEGINVVMLTDPLSQRPTDVPPGAAFGPVSVDNQVMLNDPAKIRDSWATVNDGAFRRVGRVGYSVKFVSFDSIEKKRFTTDGKTSFTNLVNGDGESADDIALIKH